MPHTAKDTTVVPYPMPKRGINLNKAFSDLHEEEALLTENMIYRNGMVKRGGQSLLNTTEADASEAVLGIHRFYYGSSKIRLVSCDDLIRKDDEDNTWTTFHTWATGNLMTHFRTWGSLDYCYASNGTDRAIRLDGTNATGSGSSIASVTSTLTVNSQPTAGQNSEIDITINGTTTTGTEGTEWDVGANEDATAADIASWLNGLTGIGASATGAVVTVTPTATTDIEAFAWDPQGTDTASMATVVHLALPAKTIQVLPYQDRLLSIDSNNAGELRWSYSYDDTQWETRANTNVKVDTYLYGMIHHSLANVDAGYQAGVLLAGANSMYLFKATSLIVPIGNIYDTSGDAGGDFTIFPLAISVGCNAPKTMVWTPKGTMWLGIDRQVYLLPFDSLTPVPVSRKVQSTQSTEGIENIPAAQISNACAVYHDGYFKLSYAPNGQTTNTRQMWLDVDRLNIDEDGYYGPWYGPMTGRNISCYSLQSGPADSGQLIGGESSSKGYIYQLDLSSDLGDIDTSTASTTDINTILQTYHNPVGPLEFRKDVHRMELEHLDAVLTFNVDFHDITGAIKTGTLLKLTGGSISWGSFNWGDFYWSDTVPIRNIIDITPAIQPRRLSIILKTNTSDVSVEIYAIRAEVKEQSLVFA